MSLRGRPARAYGPARGVADLLGLTVVLFAWLKSADPGQDRAVVQQAAWRWQG